MDYSSMGMRIERTHGVFVQLSLRPRALRRSSAEVVISELVEA